MQSWNPLVCNYVKHRHGKKAAYVLHIEESLDKKYSKVLEKGLEPRNPHSLLRTPGTSYKIMIFPHLRFWDITSEDIQPLTQEIPACLLS